MNTDNVYYLFYDQVNQELIKLDLLELSDLPSKTCFVTFPFVLNGKYAHNGQNLVNLVNEHNERVYNRYQDEYKIKPPYFIKCAYDQIGRVGVFIFYKKEHLLFYDNKISNPDDYPLIDSFVSKHKSLPFCGVYMKKLHEFIMDNQIIRPIPDSVDKRFVVRIKGKEYKAYVAKVSDDRNFLCFETIKNSYVFDCYNIGEKEVLNVLGINERRGDWPETPERKVYVLLDYINENRMAESVIDRLKIDGNKIITSFGEFEIKQTKTGKWYIRGNIEQICLLFKVPNITGLKHLVNKIIGNKIRHGVFPECDSREEITKLLKTIRDDR